ncbi:hypothetical protein FN846DRAFT_785122, partial [Sphaerosporella brunnea]
PHLQSCYNASKTGVIMLRMLFASKLEHQNNRVNTSSPGYMDMSLNLGPTLDE